MTSNMCNCFIGYKYDYSVSKDWNHPTNVSLPCSHHKETKHGNLQWGLERSPGSREGRLSPHPRRRCGSEQDTGRASVGEADPSTPMLLSCKEKAGKTTETGSSTWGQSVQEGTLEQNLQIWRTWSQTEEKRINVSCKYKTSINQEGRLYVCNKVGEHFSLKSAVGTSF